MAPNKYIWISLWFLITAPIILWDAGYVLMRPRSMEGGDMRWFWSHFQMYERIDHVYSVKGFHDKAGFAPAAAISNLIETSLNLAYLYTVHVSPRNIAPLLGFAGATMTLLKTTIWVLQEYFCGVCSMTNETQFSEMFKFWICPNIMWFTFCTLIVARLGGDISSSLNQASSKAKYSGQIIDFFFSLFFFDRVKKNCIVDEFPEFRTVSANARHSFRNYSGGSGSINAEGAEKALAFEFR